MSWRTSALPVMSKTALISRCCGSSARPRSREAIAVTGWPSAARDLPLNNRPRTRDLRDGGSNNLAQGGAGAGAERRGHVKGWKIRLSGVGGPQVRLLKRKDLSDDKLDCLAGL